jgi:hypothetical protein
MGKILRTHLEWGGDKNYISICKEKLLCVEGGDLRDEDKRKY